MTRINRTSRRVLVALAVCASLTAGAQAQQVKSLTPEQESNIRKLMTQGFPFGDANGDKRLTKAELTAYGVKEGWGTHVIDKRWKEIDTDRNGWVSTSEFAEHTIRYSNMRLARGK